MRRDVLLLAEMIDAAEQAQELASGVAAAELDQDRRRRDALLWNFTVLGEAAGQLSGEVKARFPEVTWQQPVRLRNRIVHGYWSVDVEILHTAASTQLPGFIVDLRARPRLPRGRQLSLSQCSDGGSTASLVHIDRVAGTTADAQ